MAKFEYTYLAVNHNKDVWDKHMEVLNNQGKDGWELVSAIYPISEKLHGDPSLVFLFKREVPDSSQQDR